MCRGKLLRAPRAGRQGGASRAVTGAADQPGHRREVDPRRSGERVELLLDDRHVGEPVAGEGGQQGLPGRRLVVCRDGGLREDPLRRGRGRRARVESPRIGQRRRQNGVWHKGGERAGTGLDRDSARPRRLSRVGRGERLRADDEATGSGLHRERGRGRVRDVVGCPQQLGLWARSERRRRGARGRIPGELEHIGSIGVRERGQVRVAPGKREHVPPCGALREVGEPGGRARPGPSRGFDQRGVHSP